MKAFFDTSVLLPIFKGEHPHHVASTRCAGQFDQSTGCCGAHSLVELYSSLTRLPGKHRASAEEAMLFVDNIRERLSTVALTTDEYLIALRASAERRITGGAIYDAMLAQCALKSGAEVLYTWNLKHFAQCGEEVTRLLRTPE